MILDDAQMARRVRTLAGVSVSDEARVEHDVSASMLEAVEEALLGGETHYTVRPGIPELRRRIARAIEKAGGPSPDAEDPADNVLITTGDSEALFVLLLNLGLRSGTVFVSSTGTCRHADLFRLMGLTVEEATEALRNNEELRLTYREWDSPALVQEKLLEETRTKDLPDILDLGGALMPTLLVAFPPVKPDRTVILGNLDRLPGLLTFRVAYLSGPKAHLARCRPWKQALSICSAAPSQRAALTALATAEKETS